MIDWLGWLKRLEFTTVAALAIAGLCLMIGQSAERYADATTASAARLAAREAPADGHPRRASTGSTIPRRGRSKRSLSPLRRAKWPTSGVSTPQRRVLRPPVCPRQAESTGTEPALHSIAIAQQTVWRIGRG